MHASKFSMWSGAKDTTGCPPPERFHCLERNACLRWAAIRAYKAGRQLYLEATPFIISNCHRGDWMSQSFYTASWRGFGDVYVIRLSA